MRKVPRFALIGCAFDLSGLIARTGVVDRLVGYRKIGQIDDCDNIQFGKSAANFRLKEAGRGVLTLIGFPIRSCGTTLNPLAEFMLCKLIDDAGSYDTHASYWC